MKRICSFLIACLIISACFLYAADFWEKKEFTTWSEDEASKLLLDSPWASRADFTGREMNAIRQQEMLMEQASGGMEEGNTIRGYGIRYRNDSRYIIRPDDSNERVGYGSYSLIPDIIGTGSGLGHRLSSRSHVILRWHSSLPVRQAVAVLQYKDKAGTSEEAAEMINRQLPVYILGVIGISRLPWTMDEKRLRNWITGAWLYVKGKPPIKAIEVYAEQDGENDNYYIVFPRYRDNKPLISLEDKEVEAAIGYSPYVIKKKFKLKDMQYQGKLEM